MIKISYKSGYKYQLTAPYRIILPRDLRPPSDVGNRFVWIVAGIMTLREDYAWNGADGPTMDTEDSMRGSLVHDGGYQLMREGLLDYKIFRLPLDKFFAIILVEDGMQPIRAKSWYNAVRVFGEPRARPPGEIATVEIDPTTDNE